MWLRFLHWLGFVELIWTEDFDAEMRLRVVRQVGPYRMCSGICGWQFDVRLNDDGTTTGKSYVHKWHPYKPVKDRDVKELERLMKL